MLDLTAVIPQGKKFKIDGKEYELVFHFKAIRKLEELYGSMDKAMDAFNQNKSAYEVTVNFLYAGLGDDYKLTKQEIESWVGLGSVVLLRNILFDALMRSYGTPDGEKEPGEE